MALADSPHRRVAGKAADGIRLEGYKGNPRAYTRRCGRCFRARVTATNHDNIMFHVKHSLPDTEPSEHVVEHILDADLAGHTRHGIDRKA